MEGISIKRQKGIKGSFPIKKESYRSSRFKRVRVFVPGVYL